VRFGEAERLAPMDARHALAIGRVHERMGFQAKGPERQGHLEAAVDALDRAVERAPTLAEPRLYRAWAHAGLGERFGAESDFAAVLRLEPMNARAQYYVGLWYAATDRPVQARELAAKLRAIGQNDKAAEIEQRVGNT
jgi:Flp pilus assembly protein TadD